MKVRELIERLQRENPEAEVIIKPFLGQSMPLKSVRAETLSSLRYWDEIRPDSRSTEGGASSLFRSYPAVILWGG